VTVAAKSVDTGLVSSTTLDPSSLRPFHQNWWPVVALNALDADRPNGLQVLGKHLVAVWNQAGLDNGAPPCWTVLDDRCSHRFAPLSEGRVLHSADGSSSRLQCAYHGWEFDGTGCATKVPQQPDRVDKARGVMAYPTRERAGLLWVWTDPETIEISTKVPLPVDPLLDRYVHHFGKDSCFMRDLPYGAEILVENLLDLAHLPYAHHSVGGLCRELGKELPTRMLSLAEKETNAAWEQDYKSKDGVVLPTFQAEILQAAQHDPMLQMFGARDDSGNTDSWTTTIAYYAASHVRYRRWRGPGKAGHVELFFCPTSEGRSRVFLYNVVESLLPPTGERPKIPLKERLGTAIKPSTWVKSLQTTIIKKLFDPRRSAGHMISHKIFDGDGIFLHKQGNRMREAGLSYKDYSTPSSADVLLNAYRRFLDSAAAKTRQAGLDDIADAVVGSGQYGDDAARSVFLDRYNTHTVHCPICTRALQKTRARKVWMKVLQTALQGALGTAVTALAVLAPTSRVVSTPPRLLRVLVGVVAGISLGSLSVARAETKLEQEINQFLFEDYVHADKN